MKLQMKRWISLILAMVMVLGMVPMTAIAAGTTFSKESIGALSASQDAAIFDGKIFVPNTSGNCAVYNLSTRAKIDDFAFAKYSTITPHGNTICFGNTYYQDGDKYPLLYVPLWNKSNSTKGTCCVYRVMEDASGKFSSSLVQVIKIGFVDDGTLWSPSTSTRPYGTFVVDNDNSKLYIAVTRDADSKTRYFEFAIPAITAGTVNDEYGCNVVTLEEEDILRRFDSDFTNYQQGITYHDGKIYASAGFVSSGVPAALYIIDLATGDTTDAYVLGDYGLSAQPCWISEDPDTGKIYYGNNDNVMYLLSFKEPDPGHEHSYTSEIIPPTCEKEGYTLYTCACGYSYKDTYTEAGHNYVAGVCSVCDDSVLGTDWIAPDFAEGDYSMVAIPDPQRLVQLWPNKYYALAQWIADNKTAHNIQAVMYMGDMVHNKDGTVLDELYPISKNATAILDNTGIPWMPMMGNHDPSNKFNSYYDYATYGSGRSWFGGSYHDDQLDHTYWYVTVGEREYMILSLGYNPGNSVLAWAQDVVEDNQDKNVIITTHSCINRDGSFLSEGTRIWNALSSYENVVLSLCGHLHSPDIVTRTDKNGVDKDVTTFLLDRQDDDAENHYAMIALFTFDEDSDTVSVNWYSTYYDALYKSANQFTFNVPHIEVEEECEHSYETVVTPPTCTEQGYTTYTCACGDSYVADYVDATGEHTYENGICTGCGSSALDGNYTHAIPENQGVQNAIDRAYSLTDVEWTPLANVPGVKKINGEFTVVPFEAGKTYRGIPYSGVTANDCYVGLNVSLESFMTALENENSVLYTENLFSTNPKSATYFGTVCSKFVQYALDVPGSYNTNNVANIPGMETIALPGKYTVDQIKLGDVVLHTQNHTTICTDILYDADGNVAFIEISEAAMPLCRRMYWSPEEFYEHFEGYRLCRYQYIDQTPAIGETELTDDYALMPRFGDKYNYKVSSTKATVDVLESGYHKAVILRDGVVIDEIVLNGATAFKFDRSVPGYLEMYLEKEDGTRSNSVYANVVKSSVSVDDSKDFARGALTVTIDGSCGAPLYVQVGSAHAIFCNVEGLEGTVEITFPTSKISSRQVRVAYQNEYGIYLSNWVSFTADENPSKDPLLSQGQYWNGYNITPSSPTPVVQENRENYWSYTMIPVEENTTYYSWGATRIWYLDAKGDGISTYNAYKDSTVPCQFTTPEGTAYVSIAYSPNLLNQGEEKIEKLSADSEDGNDEEEIVPSNPSTDPYLSQGEYWDGYTLTPSSHTPVVQSGKTEYWTYTMILVEENTTYYSKGCNRMWFLDAKGNPISTFNANTESDVRFQFTTPAGTAYVSITYAPSGVDKGTESMQHIHTYENGVCTGCGEADPNVAEPLALRYDDHYDVTGKTVEIIDAGKPISYQVGYGVEENAVLDTAVVTLEGNYLVATGIGTAKVKIDGVLYEVTVTAAPISLLLVIGQSNAEGMVGNANQSVACENGQVYSTYAKANGLTGDAGLTVENASNYVPSALTGQHSTVNVNGTDTKLSGHPVNSLTEEGSGKYGMDSGLAYEWTKQTGEKVWVVNAAHGASSISSWQPGQSNYEEAKALLGACQEVLMKEIAAGHYTFSHMGYYWCQGCADETKSAEWYVGQYLAMHEGLKTEFSFDGDLNVNTPDDTMEFGNIVLVMAGHENAAGYRTGTYTDSSDNFFASFKELEMRGPRVAQIWMANNPELEDIHIVCTLAQDWVTMPDGSDGVAEYFATHYENGVIDYPTQVKQSTSWYKPTTPAAVKNSIHYYQVGYNEVGRESVRNTLYILGLAEKPDVETTVTFVDWTGYQIADTVKTSTVASTNTLVVPMVYPCYESKNVTYSVSDNLIYSYYDLLDSGVDGGTLTASIGSQSVQVIGRDYYAYRFELDNGKMVSVSDSTFRENALTQYAGQKVFTTAEPIILKHDQPWRVEFNSVATDRFMALATTPSSTEGMFYFFKSASNSGVLSMGEYKDGKYQNYGLLQHKVDIDWNQPHVYRFQNVINEDGTNTVHIYIDDVWTCTATELIIDGASKGTGNMYLSGKDFAFTSVGCGGFGLSTGQMTYLEVWEDYHAHTYENGICTGCGAKEPGSYIPGDITGDGELNNKDVTRLFKYLSGYDVEVDEAALDVNGDGEINNKDVTRLFRYLSGFDVTIH